jgi:hypothetical protein
MVTVQSSGSGIASRIPQPKHFRQIVNTPGVLTLMGEIAGLTENNLSPEEMRELMVFDDFLSNHVQPNRIYSVQCMMLWSEWVRSFRKQSRRFPQLVLEKEFRSIISDRFGVEAAHDSVFGIVYPGLRFVA